MTQHNNLVLALGKALYAQLTPAQRAILDQGYALQCGPWGLFGD